jgi:hypothetical protein
LRGWRVPFQANFEETNVSEDPKHADPKHDAPTIRASKGGGGGKLLLGAVAAAVLVGGGYFAWKTYGSQQNNAQTAYNDAYSSNDSDDPLRAVALNQTATSGRYCIDRCRRRPSSTETRSSTARRSSSAREPVVAEETIGITPINATTDATDGEDIVVTAARRPIWVRTPSQRRLSALYPERALSAAVKAKVTRCTVQGDGRRLRPCL